MPKKKLYFFRDRLEERKNEKKSFLNSLHVARNVSILSKIKAVKNYFYCTGKNNFVTNTRTFNNVTSFSVFYTEATVSIGLKNILVG